MTFRCLLKKKLQIILRICVVLEWHFIFTTTRKRKTATDDLGYLCSFRITFSCFYRNKRNTKVQHCVAVWHLFDNKMNLYSANWSTFPHLFQALTVNEYAQQIWSISLQKPRLNCKIFTVNLVSEIIYYRTWVVVRTVPFYCSHRQENAEVQIVSAT